LTTGVTSPEELARQAELVARVRAARARRDLAVEQTTAELHRAMRDAYDAGALVRDIAAAAGLTRQRVHQILNG
jgi:hypothetical protein